MSRKLSTEQKNHILYTQQFQCANSLINVIENYTCPISDKTFDGCSYKFVEFQMTNGPTTKNVYALCINCYNVRKSRMRKEQQTPNISLDFNPIDMEEKIKNGFYNVTLTNYDKWTALEKWASSKTCSHDENGNVIINILSVYAELGIPMVNLYHHFKSYRSLCEKGTFDEMPVPIWNEIKRDIHCLVIHSKNIQYGQEILVELVELLEDNNNTCCDLHP